jgi:hypothetical protein
VDQAEFGKANRQVAEGGHHPPDDFDVSGAANGLKGEGAIAIVHDQHLLAKALPVAAAFPNPLAKDLWRTDFVVALVSNQPSEVVLKQAEQQKAAWMPESHSRGLFLKMKQIQSLAKRAMIVWVKHLQAPIETLLGPSGARCCARMPHRV